MPGRVYGARGARTTTFPNVPVPRTLCISYCFFLLADEGWGRTFWETIESIGGVGSVERAQQIMCARNVAQILYKNEDESLVVACLVCLADARGSTGN